MGDLTEPSRSDVPPTPGWYDGDDGRKRYWTGHEWLVADREIQDDGNLSIGVPRAKRSSVWRWLIFGTVVALIGVGALVIAEHKNNESSQDVVPTATATETPKMSAFDADRKAAEEKARADAKAQADTQKLLEDAADEVVATNKLIDKEMWKRKNGRWSVGVSGSLYYKFADSNDYSCGYLSCVAVYLYSMDGCTSGVYVKADLLKGDTVVGWTNEISGSLEEEESASVLLEGRINDFDTFRISDVHCMSK